MALSSGVYSLIGVVIGSAGTGGFQLGLAMRSERRDLYAARRLVGAELLSIEVALEQVLEHSSEPPTKGTLAAMGAHAMWDKYSEALARDRRTAWHNIDAVYATTPQFADSLWHHSAAGNEDFIRRLVGDVQRARKALGGTPKPWPRQSASDQTPPRRP